MKKDIPVISADQMRQVDELAIQHGLIVMQMMEHAGLHTARLVTQQYPNAKKITLLCGSGNNGGDGLAAARFLMNWGYEPQIILTHPESHLKDIPMHHLALAQNMGVPIADTSQEQSVSFLKSADVLIDAMIGYALDGEPREPIAGLIRQVNASPKPVLSIDNPSGLDMTTGTPSLDCIRADETLTLALPKNALLEPGSQEYVGRLFLADLGIPAMVYRELGIQEPEYLFKTSSILAL